MEAHGGGASDGLGATVTLCVFVVVHRLSGYAAGGGRGSGGLGPSERRFGCDPLRRGR